MNIIFPFFHEKKKKKRGDKIHFHITNAPSALPRAATVARRYLLKRVISEFMKTINQPLENNINNTPTAIIMNVHEYSTLVLTQNKIKTRFNNIPIQTSMRYRDLSEHESRLKSRRKFRDVGLTLFSYVRASWGFFFFFNFYSRPTFIPKLLYGGVLKFPNVFDANPMAVTSCSSALFSNRLFDCEVNRWTRTTLRAHSARTRNARESISRRLAKPKGPTVFSVIVFEPCTSDGVRENDDGGRTAARVAVEFHETRFNEFAGPSGVRHDG